MSVFPVPGGPTRSALRNGSAELVEALPRKMEKKGRGGVGEDYGFWGGDTRSRRIYPVVSDVSSWLTNSERGSRKRNVLTSGCLMNSRI